MMTKEIWEALTSAVPPHRGFEFQPIDYGDYIGIRIFLDNLAEFSRPQQEDLCVWLVNLGQTINTKFGAPVFFEGDEKYYIAHGISDTDRWLING